MMRRLVAVALLALVLWLPDPLLAGKGRSGGSFGGSRSSSGGSRSSSGGSKSSSSWGGSSSSKSSSSSKPSTSSSWGSKSSSPPPISKPSSASAADVQAHQKSVQANSFNSRTFGNQNEARDAALTDFRQKYSTQYPSTYDKQPGSRPEHIPEKATINGKEAPVEWRTEGGRGGYYYQDTLGRWILYDMMSDSLHRDRYLYRHGYDPSGYRYTGHHSGGGETHYGRVLFWIAILVVLFLAFVVFLYYYHSPGRTFTPRARTAAPPPPVQVVSERATTSTAEPAHWERIKPGDVVTLKDRETLELLLEEGKGRFARGVDLTVRTVRRIEEQRGLMKWTLAELEGVPIEGEEKAWYLLVKAVDDEFDLRVMFAPEGFEPGSRAELIEQGTRWLFKEPADENNFDPAKLEFADTIDNTQEDGRVVVFRRKPQGLLFGAATEEPKPSGLSATQFTVVMEYRADADCANPELLILEVGGLVQVFQGTNVGLQDVELMAV